MQAMRFAIAAVMVTAATGQAQGAFITILLDQTIIGANTGSSYAQFVDTHVSLDGIDYTYTATRPGNSNKTTTNFDASNPDAVTLTSTFEQVRSGGYLAVVSTYASIRFRVNDPSLSYEVSGDYTNTDGLTRLTGTLYDLTLSQYILFSLQESQSTPNESLVTGGSGGDFSNSFSGSLTGALISGHDYQYFYQVMTYAYPDADTGATASGRVTLTISRPSTATTVTPEPTALALAGFASIGMTVGAWRHRKGQSARRDRWSRI